MGNYYQGRCFSSDLEFHQEVASNCPTVSPDGAFTISCAPSSTKVVITRKQGGLLGSTTTTDYFPQKIACDPAKPMNDATDAAWLIVGVWVAAWAARKVAAVIKG